MYTEIGLDFKTALNRKLARQKGLKNSPGALYQPFKPWGGSKVTLLTPGPHFATHLKWPPLHVNLKLYPRKYLTPKRCPGVNFGSYALSKQPPNKF